MPVCAICGQDRDAGQARIIHTAKLIRRESLPGATRYTYGEFRDHPYFVCVPCSRRDRILLPLAIVAALVVTVLLVIAAVRMHRGWYYLGALLWIITSALAIEQLASTYGKLSRMALKERGGSSATLEYIALRERKYRKAISSRS